jgi:hypothetical protein
MLAESSRQCYPILKFYLKIQAIASFSISPATLLVAIFTGLGKAKTNELLPLPIVRATECLALL